MLFNQLLTHDTSDRLSDEGGNGGRMGELLSARSKGGKYRRKKLYNRFPIVLCEVWRRMVACHGQHRLGFRVEQ